MATIQLLDQNTINKIAAGEVVERPASVIKELVENAIDAGADAITVEVKDGGLKLIRVTDNGMGIKRDEIRTAFLRHSTSKIRKASDLIDIHSLGFRGEALASIAAVSMVELLTKQEADVTGIRYRIEGGAEQGHEEVGCPAGTTFIIKDLFYNTPARLKFMKTPSTELGYISDLINKMAMGHPEIGLKFISNGKIKLHTTGNKKLKDCVYAVYGKEVAKNLLEVDYANETMAVKGFVGKPHISRGNRSYENYYINGRYIKSKVIEKALEDSFKSKLMMHRYPFASFHIEILSKDVDVNVHPTKMEVRFMNEEDVYRLVFEGINQAFLAKELIPKVNLDKKEDSKEQRRTEKSKAKEEEVEAKKNHYEPFEYKKEEVTKPLQVKESINLLDLNKKTYEAKVGINSHVPEVSMNRQQAIEGDVAQAEIAKDSDLAKSKADFYKGDQVEIETAKFIDSSAVKSHKIIGQLFETYWIVELEDQYYMIDQHAAHEKVLYERLLGKIESKVGYGQRLLRPVVVELSLQELGRYQAHKQLFDELGFEVESFGEESLIIRSVPFVFFDKV